MVSTLTREVGMTAPDAMSGDIVEALADGGLFRLRSVLIGTVPFSAIRDCSASAFPWQRS
ncbi:hypothetical protein GCM10007920_11300 [Ciceribacter naphthalenivorans]|uniref:Uncharacterized protein n=2 Tax=Alphaproteobacteria TaxID=28211 RepID=A0A512HLE9_9HYPH|nr:hypothetical protein RNA01_32100 [Ciceribacter naphthalenivorans]GLR21344.1 hypothetical protein GCM10007920_11300 [Ciceribacter naphthalenivorans]GLT04200.1 hypothetical protein GCM10007926_11300 [Sphingomonas psychrolutea]